MRWKVKRSGGFQERILWNISNQQGRNSQKEDISGRCPSGRNSFMKPWTPPNLQLPRTLSEGLQIIIIRESYYLFREDEDTENQCVVPPDQDELDPRMFAPTGDIYSYFQKRRYQPFSSPGLMMYSTRTALGGRILKSHVYWPLIESILIYLI